jgi:hypothetical protein
VAVYDGGKLVELGAMLIDDENDLVELAILGVELAILGVELAILGVEPAVVPIEAIRDVVEFAVVHIEAIRDIVELAVVSGHGSRNLGQQLVDRCDIDAVAAAHRIRATLLISDRDRPFAEQYGRPPK